MPAADDFGATVLRTAGIESLDDPAGSRRPGVRSARQDVIDSLSAGSIRGEGLSPTVEVMPPGIDQATQKDFQLHRLRSELPNAAAAEPAHAVRRFNVAMDVRGLIEIEHPIRTPAQRVDDVVGILRTE